MRTADSLISHLPVGSPRAFIVPLDIATVAALTPAEVAVDLWDEAVKGQILAATMPTQSYDLVGVTGYELHFARVKQISQLFRSRGVPLVVGGPGVSAAPEYYRDHFDVLLIGEAEYTWPQFIRDWLAGRHRNEYRQVTKVDLGDSPLPRWDSIEHDMRYYLAGAVQTTRGCPFDCEFCDVVYLYGHQTRHKPIDRVLQEVAALERLGLADVFVCDDNFIGDRRYAKALLDGLIALNRSFRRPLSFFTQITLNVAKDDEMLALLADANFSGLFIGIESPNVESLVETNKPQNYRTDMLASVRKIQSYGLPVWGSMVVGFDHDDASIFEQQFRFVQESCIAVPSITVLMARVGTKLWVRLQREGRILNAIESETPADKTGLTNIVPEQMTRVELMTGYRDLVHKLRLWRHFEDRVRGLILGLRRRPTKGTGRVPSPWWWLAVVGFVITKMDREARWTSLRLLLLTWRRAPWMLEKVAALIFHEHIEVLRLPSIRQSIDEQVQTESMDPTRLKPEEQVFSVPAAFEQSYQSMFPELHKRAYGGLVDKSQTDEVLVEAVYGFLTGWGPGLAQLEDHHRVSLNEFCDRSVAARNADAHQAPSPAAGGGQLPDIRRNRLADEVLRAVEQKLRSFQPPAFDHRVATRAAD